MSGVPARIGTRKGRTFEERDGEVNSPIQMAKADPPPEAGKLTPLTRGASGFGMTPRKIECEDGARKGTRIQFGRKFVYEPGLQICGVSRGETETCGQ